MKAVRVVAWVLIFVVIGVTAASWIPALDIDEDDARTVALGAMRAGGYEDAAVDQPIVFDEAGHPSTADDDAQAGDDDARATDDTDDADAQAAWIVPVDVDDATIEFRVDKRGQLLFVDDLIGEDQQERFFSDDEWENVRLYDAGILTDWITRNIAGSVAAMLIVGTGFVIAKRSEIITTADARVGGVHAVLTDASIAPATPPRIRARPRLAAPPRDEPGAGSDS